MKLPSSTEVYLAMIPRRSSLVSCFGSGSESMSSSMISVVLSSINATGRARRHPVDDGTVRPRYEGGIMCPPATMLPARLRIGKRYAMIHGRRLHRSEVDLKSQQFNGLRYAPTLDKLVTVNGP